jgi:hypothetical protein
MHLKASNSLQQPKAGKLRNQLERGRVQVSPKHYPRDATGPYSDRLRWQITSAPAQVEVWALVGSGAPHSNRRLDLKFCIDTSRKVSLERWKNLKLLASVFSMNYDKGLSAEKSEKTVLEIWEKKRCEITLLEGGVPVLCCYIINHPETVTYRNNNHLFCLWIQCTRLGRSHSGSFTGWQSDGERCWVILNCSCASLVLGWEANSWGSSETYVSYIHIYMYVYIHVYIYIRTHIYN